MIKKDIHCPDCGKLIAKEDEDAKISGIYLYCKRCKKEVKYSNLNAKSQ